MTPRVFWTSVAAAVCLGFLQRPVSAFTPGACRQDEQKFCGDAGNPGDKRACMTQHASELSAACQENISEGKAKMEEKAKEVMAACGAELKQYCANVTPGQGRELACLHAYGDKLSDACKATLPKPGMRRGMLNHGPSGPSQGDKNAPPPPDAQ